MGRSAASHSAAQPPRVGAELRRENSRLTGLQRGGLQRAGPDLQRAIEEGLQPYNTPATRAQSPMPGGSGPVGLNPPLRSRSPPSTPYQIPRGMSAMTPGTPQFFSGHYRGPPIHRDTAAAIAAGLGHATPRGTPA